MTDPPRPNPQPARRRAFDKETATTWFLAGVLGFGGGLAWRLAQEMKPDVTSSAIGFTEQEPMSVYLLPADPADVSAQGAADISGERATIVVVRGQGRAPVATTRAS